MISSLSQQSVPDVVLDRCLVAQEETHLGEVCEVLEAEEGEQDEQLAQGLEVCYFGDQERLGQQAADELALPEEVGERVGGDLLAVDLEDVDVLDEGVEAVEDDSVEVLVEVGDEQLGDEQLGLEFFETLHTEEDVVVVRLVVGLCQTRALLVELLVHLHDLSVEHHVDHRVHLAEVDELHEAVWVKVFHLLHNRVQEIYSLLSELLMLALWVFLHLYCIRRGA